MVRCEQTAEARRGPGLGEDGERQSGDWRSRGKKPPGRRRKMNVQGARTGRNGRRLEQGFQSGFKDVGVFEADNFLAKNALAVVEHGRG